MIYYSREIKTLVIPEGIGSTAGSSESYNSGYTAGVRDGKAAQKAADDAKITPTTTITENGSYEADYGFREVVVNVSGSDCSEAIETAYDSGYTAGYAEGEMDGSSTGYESGYTEGVEAGKAEQKSKLASVRVTANGVYESEDGYGTVTVAVPEGSGTSCNIQESKILDVTQGYEQVYPDTGYDGLAVVAVDAQNFAASNQEIGAAQQRGRLSSTTITKNGTYSSSDGWSSVTVNVTGGACNLQEKTVEAMEVTGTYYPDAGFDGMSSVYVNGANIYNNGKIVGQSEQKQLLSSTTITQNGTYTRENGWNSVTVNVPEADCEDAFLEGMRYVRDRQIGVTITENGTYIYGETAGPIHPAYYGVSSVTVNVPIEIPFSAVQSERVYTVASGESNYVYIYPESSYTAMRVCKVDVNEVYHRQREAGIEYARSMMKAESVTITQNGTYTYGEVGNKPYGVGSVTVNVQPSVNAITAEGTFTVDNDVTMSSSDGYRMFTSSMQGYIKDENGNYIVNGTDADILGQTLYSGQTYSFYFVLGTISNGVITWSSGMQNTPIEYVGYTSATANFTTNLNYKIQ